MNYKSKGYRLIKLQYWLKNSIYSICLIQITVIFIGQFIIDVGSDYEAFILKSIYVSVFPVWRYVPVYSKQKKHTVTMCVFVCLCVCM